MTSGSAGLTTSGARVSGGGAKMISRVTLGLAAGACLLGICMYVRMYMCVCMGTWRHVTCLEGAGAKVIYVYIHIYSYAKNGAYINVCIYVCICIYICAHTKHSQRYIHQCLHVLSSRKRPNRLKNRIRVHMHAICIGIYTRVSKEGCSQILHLRKHQNTQNAACAEQSRENAGCKHSGRKDALPPVDAPPVLVPRKRTGFLNWDITLPLYVCMYICMFKSPRALSVN